MSPSRKPEITPSEIDLNQVEDSIAGMAEVVLSERCGARFEIVPGLPQMLTPEFYMSAETPPEALAFGRIIPSMNLLVVGVDAKLKNALAMDSGWMVDTLEKAWSPFFPDVSCQLGNWDSDRSKIRRLPPGINLRFMRYSVFRYREGRPEQSGYFDVLARY